MKLKDIYISALKFMGYGYNSDISADFPLPEEPLDLCNRALLDIGLKAAQNLEEEINAEPEILETLGYGVAMFVCIFTGDSVRQPIYTNIYNAKRAKALSRIEKIKDVMVNGEV